MEGKGDGKKGRGRKNKTDKTIGKGEERKGSLEQIILMAFLRKVFFGPVCRGREREGLKRVEIRHFFQNREGD